MKNWLRDEFDAAFLSVTYTLSPACALSRASALALKVSYKEFSDILYS
ncbi:hypothetical protein HCH_04513 [Hahella chejuensis KCTC 2396]|uniref:Uncharacterized protein n=1 Tax=Hahella chejuensis (strain KCTC 2396) TaxID=349521 RepID=Q2SDR0_HAHCH|nr:hypothetical protein HCH_04513 [Hahella chejuensis KCTC 2396]